MIVAGRRTPIARLDGDLAALDAQTLATIVVRALIEDVGVAPDAVADVILATAAGPGGNLARRVALGEQPHGGDASDTAQPRVDTAGAAVQVPQARPAKMFGHPS